MKKRYSFDLRPDERMKLEEFIPTLKELIARASKFGELDKVKEELKQELYKAEEELKEDQENERLRRIRVQEIEQEKIIEKPVKKEYVNTIVSGKKSYTINELSDLDRRILLDKDFIRVEQTDIDGKKQTYIVFDDKFESPRHIISTKEIVDYLKLFTDEITTYRTAMPDIVFEANGKKHAIEVETGTIIKDKEKMKNKLKLLKERFEDNWFFFVTNRNLEKKYSKLGDTSTKRNIKFKIRQIFKNSRKRGKSATGKNFGGKSHVRR